MPGTTFSGKITKKKHKKGRNVALHRLLNGHVSSMRAVRRAAECRSVSGHGCTRSIDFEVTNTF